MSIPLTAQPRCAASKARFPVPHPTSSTDDPGLSGSPEINSLAAGSRNFATWPKSPDSQTTFWLALTV